MYEYKEFQIPVVVYHDSTRQTEYNDAFNAEFSGKDAAGALEIVKNFIGSNLRNQISLPYASQIYINDCNYICVHFKSADEETSFAVLASLPIDNALVSKEGNNLSEMSNYLQKNFSSIIAALHNDLVLTDQEGRIKVVLPNFESFYGIPAGEALNRTVTELEESKVLSPSVVANALRTGQEECLLQRTLSGKYLMAYAKPIYNAEGEIESVISYSRDLTQYEQLKRQYDYLYESISKYSVTLTESSEIREINDEIIGCSDELSSIKNILHAYAKFDANVLLTGESGVGKTLYAKVLHEQSSRSGGPFISVNCGAISENLFESEFFGYERGAFTGASMEGKKGLIEAAHGGTLFLDEIADLPKAMQVKLLKVLDSRTITRVGGLTDIPVDFRLIAATNKDIPALIEKGEFREDLYFRINLLPLEIPPLRNHPKDIPVLIKAFTEECLKKYNIVKRFSTKAISMLMDYSWPGNIRELKNTVERLCLITNHEIIDYFDLPDYIQNQSDQGLMAGKDFESLHLSLPEVLESVEKKILLSAYEKYGSTTKVAKALGISQPSVSVKLKKYMEKEKSEN